MGKTEEAYKYAVKNKYRYVLLNESGTKVIGCGLSRQTLERYSPQERKVIRVKQLGKLTSE